MKKNNPLVEMILEKLSPHGPIKARAMFGGYGIYYEDIIFASIVENELYFRIDEHNRKDYEGFASKPFIYEGMNKPVIMPYLTLPEEILNNPLELPKWIQKSVQASLRYKRSKKKY